MDISNLNRSTDLRHLAVIMDGNGRWARKRGLKRLAGHQQGAEAVIRMVDECPRYGIRFLTLFAFSSENWGRPEQEVRTLMDLLMAFLSSQRQKMLENGVRLKVIGDRSRLSADVQQALEDVEVATAERDRLVLTLALSYGGRNEIVRAVREIAGEVAAGSLPPEKIDGALIESHLDTHGLPAPDLLVRTSGEMRISNFLLWQLAYSELYFTETLWPDFDANELGRAVDEYCSRQRRFGLTEEQLLDAKDSMQKERHN
ncbi:MAG: di-trans,poly-cis-decaprenylcistransferase [Desulfuromonas sp.]|nr:MAG: di-trans,poly-cis-decaprenylcistransferase [Desulfuromonas sp.]